MFALPFAPLKAMVVVPRDLSAKRNLSEAMKEADEKPVTPEGQKTVYQGVTYGGVPGAPRLSPKCKRRLNYE